MTITPERVHTPANPAAFEVTRVRRDFPVLDQRINGQPLAYLDNAASAQKPEAMIAAVAEFYRHDYANVHRGVHALSERATAGLEHARDAVRGYLNARSTREIIFLRGTTEAINLVAQSYGRRFREGDEIILGGSEHHANIVPWQLIAEHTGARIVVLPIDRNGELELARLPELITARTRMVAVTHVSNALGTINPVAEIIATAHAHDIPVLVDGAQAMAHMRVDVQALDADFYCFSGHKMFAPTGIGALYGKEALLEAMPPYQGGGEMIRRVSFESSDFAELPAKFEAGTPHIAGAIGLGATLAYLSELDFAGAGAHEAELTRYAHNALATIPGLRIIGTASSKVPVVSFVIEDIHPHDLGTVLDQFGVAVRSGHHCAMPVMRWFEVPATTRASLAFYNTTDEIDRLVTAIHHARELLL